ncbi:hypothetical protein M405DRAFT_856326 [Rhizopogon salebrosus TDB-379]|nr:hypothetical protein M405DRAFT_856326 [Rhizopogon salebrosus TDB-379]
MSRTSANQFTDDETLAAPHSEVLPHMQCMGEIESRPWVFTIIRARGYQPLRPEKSWRPIVSVVVDEHSHYEVNLGCDGQNPNLKERFVMRDADGRSQVNISVYHQAQSKKKHKKRCLVATTSLSLQALSKLKGTDSEHSFKIPLSPVAQSVTRGSSRGKVVSVHIIAKLEVPETQARLMHDSSTSEDYLSGDIMSLGDSSPGSESESDETTDFPCSNRPITPTVSPELPGILICRGYISDTDDDRPLDEHVRLTNASYENSTSIDNDDDLIYIAPSLLPRYTEQISVDNSLSFIDALVDFFSFYRELREANSDS